MRWAPNIYTTENTAAKKRGIMKKAMRGQSLAGIYFVSLSSNGKDLFDVFNASQLLQDAYVWKDPYIVGIAEDRGAAFELVRVIVDDIYRKTGGFDVEGYFKPGRGGVMR